jgi:hypothetical protein
VLSRQREKQAEMGSWRAKAGEYTEKIDYQKFRRLEKFYTEIRTMMTMKRPPTIIQRVQFPLSRESKLSIFSVLRFSRPRLFSVMSVIVSITTELM